MIEVRELRDHAILRSEEIRKRNKKLAAAGLLSVVLCLTGILTVMMEKLAATGVLSSQNTDEMYYYYATLLLAPQAGGHIILGIICFTMGVLLAWYCLRKRHRGFFDSEDNGCDQRDDT